MPYVAKLLGTDAFEMRYRYLDYTADLTIWDMKVHTQRHDYYIEPEEVHIGTV